MVGEKDVCLQSANRYTVLKQYHFLLKSLNTISLIKNRPLDNKFPYENERNTP